jgi:hypothetical protein
MSKPIHKFPMHAIVKMPGFNAAPGKIRSRVEHDDRPPEYFVEGMPGPRRAPSDYFTEGALIDANPPEPPAPHVIASAKKRTSKRR